MGEVSKKEKRKTRRWKDDGFAHYYDNIHVSWKLSCMPQCYPFSFLHSVFIFIIFFSFLSSIASFFFLSTSFSIFFLCTYVSLQVYFLSLFFLLFFYFPLPPPFFFFFLSLLLTNQLHTYNFLTFFFFS